MVKMPFQSSIGLNDRAWNGGRGDWCIPVTERLPANESEALLLPGMSVFPMGSPQSRRQGILSRVPPGYTTWIQLFLHVRRRSNLFHSVPLFDGILDGHRRDGTY